MLFDVFGDRIDETEDDADAEEYINDGEYFAGISVWREITVADCRQRGNAEIKGVEPAPFFKMVIEVGAGGQDADDEKHQASEFRVFQAFEDGESVFEDVDDEFEHTCLRFRI